jgi:hypothetical protein
MTLVLDWITLDCHDPKRLGSFWAEVLDYDIDGDDEETLLFPKDGSKRRILLGKVPEDKSGKNRIHFDLRPDDQDVEVARLEALGATRADIGQGDVSWVVMADPEGNEFCVLRALQGDEDVSWGD